MNFRLFVFGKASQSLDSLAEIAKDQNFILILSQAKLPFLEYHQASQLMDG